MVQRKEKKIVHQKETINKLSKLTSFFTSGASEGSKQNNPSNSSQQENNETTLGTIFSSENNQHYDVRKPLTDFSGQIQYLIENISHDPGDYCDALFTEKVRELWIRKGPDFFQNKDCDFSEASTSYIEPHSKIKTRNLTKTVFIRKLKNDESVEKIAPVYR